MFTFYTNTLLPALDALFVALDAVLGWSLLFGAITGLVIAGLLTGLLVNVIQKFASNQDFLGRSKADLDKIKSLRAAAKQSGDKDTVSRLNALAGRISGRYAWGSFKPALWSIPPLCVLAMWVGSRMSYEPVRPDSELTIVAHFEDGASGFAHLVPSDAISPVGSAIAPVAIPPTTTASPVKVPQDSADSSAKMMAPSSAQNTAPPQAGISSTAAQDVALPSSVSAQQPALPGAGAAGPQASWTIRALREGVLPLVIRYRDQSYEVALPVSAKGGRPPELKVFALETPGRDGLLAVEFKLADTLAPAYWNLNLQWMGLYLIAALASGLGLRRVMGIN